MGVPLTIMEKMFYILLPDPLYYTSSHHDQHFAPLLTTSH